MKQTIRLTESELTKVIRRTINEMKKDDSPRVAPMRMTRMTITTSMKNIK